MNSPRNRQRLIGDPYLNPLCMHWGTMKVIFTSSSSNRWWFKKVQGRLRNSYTGWSKCQEGQISEALQWPSEVAKTKASPYPCQRCRCFAVNRNIKEISGTPDATPLCSALHIIYSLPIHYFQVCPLPSALHSEGKLEEPHAGQVKGKGGTGIKVIHWNPPVARSRMMTVMSAVVLTTRPTCPHPSVYSHTVRFSRA